MKMTHDELEDATQDFYDFLDAGELSQARLVANNIGDVGHEGRALRLHRVANTWEAEYEEDVKTNNAVDAALGK